MQPGANTPKRITFMDRRRTILLVDDDEMARDVISRLLRRALPGWTVEIAVNGEGGWKLYEQLQPELLITDMKMGGMTGRELIARVRAVSADVPILVISGAPEPAGVAGATDIILKVNFEELITKVKGLLAIC
jgi:CheY-like chemotaxis protein